MLKRHQIWDLVTWLKLWSSGGRPAQTHPTIPTTIMIFVMQSWPFWHIWCEKSIQGLEVHNNNVHTCGTGVIDVKESADFLHLFVSCVLKLVVSSSLCFWAQSYWSQLWRFIAHIIMKAQQNTQSTIHEGQQRISLCFPYKINILTVISFMIFEPVNSAVGEKVWL